MDAAFYDRFPELETARLRLRELREDDAEAVFAAFRDPEVTRFYDVATMTDLGEARALTARLQRRFHERSGIRWAIERKADRAVIGTCGYPALVAQANRGTIGYELARHAWGQGLASEAVTAIVGFGHGVLGLHRIDALVICGNAASATLLHRCGFAFEGVLRGYGRFQGVYRDLEMFARVAPHA